MVDLQVSEKKAPEFELFMNFTEQLKGLANKSVENGIISFTEKLTEFSKKTPVNTELIITIKEIIDTLNKIRENSRVVDELQKEGFELSAKQKKLIEKYNTFIQNEAIKK